MLKNKVSSRTWFIASVVCLIAGIIAWLPNFIYNYVYSYWMLTFVINPIGAYFGVLAHSKFAIISNIVMTFSFFLIMFIGYVINALFG